MEIVPAIPEDNYIKVNLSDGLVLAAQQNVDDTGIILVPDPTLDQSSYVEKEHPNDEFANKFYIDCSELNITQQRSIDHIEITNQYDNSRITYIDNLENDFTAINSTLTKTIPLQTAAEIIYYYTINGVTYIHYEIVFNYSSGSINVSIAGNIQGTTVYGRISTVGGVLYSTPYFLVEYCHYVLGSREKLYMVNKQLIQTTNTNFQKVVSEIEALGFPNDDYTFEDMHIQGVPTS